MSEVIAESGKFRVRIEPDIEAKFPDFIRSALVCERDHYVEYNDKTKLGPAFRAAYENHDADVVERWLKIFHGVCAVTNSVATGRTWYWALLTPEAAIEYGISPEQYQTTVDEDAEAFAEWSQGHVYAYVIERSVAWQRLGSDGEPVFSTEKTTMHTWEVVESCSGIYDYEVAASEARTAFETHVNATT